MKVNKSFKKQGLECAQGIADWLCMVQSPHLDSNPAAGSFSAVVKPDGSEWASTNWNTAFASMGLLAASKAFNCPRYEVAALRMGNYLKALQIFDPFHPQTLWCYSRINSANTMVLFARYTFSSLGFSGILSPH